MPRRFKTTVQLDSGLVIQNGAAAGKVLTSDASGSGVWADGTPGPQGPVGDTGPQGPQGIQGPGAGTRVYAGNGPPPLSLGIQGDWYQDRLTGALYGPKDVWADNPLNKHPNPSIESDYNGYTQTASVPSTSGVSERTQAWAQHGTSSYHSVIVTTAGGNYTINTNNAGLSAGITIDPAKTYSVQVHHRLRNSPPFTTGGVTLRIAWYKSDGAASAISTQTGALGYKNGVAGDVLVLQGLNVAPPSDAAFARLLMYSPQSAGATWDADTDNVVFVEGATLPLSWPQIPSVGGVDSKIIAGQGAPSAALGAKGDWWLDTLSNTLYGPKATYPDTPGQLITNPSLETDLSGWVTTTSVPAGSRVFARENVWAQHGSWSCHSLITRQVLTGVTVQPVGDGTASVPVNPAKKYSMQVIEKLRRGTASDMATPPSMRMVWYDAAGVQALNVGVIDPRSGAAGDVIFHTIEGLVPPANAAFVRPFLAATLNANGIWDADIDSFVMFEGATLPVSWPTTGIDLDAVAAHASTHKLGGSDAIRLDELALPTADVALNARKLTGVADPAAAQDAATKAYVDQAAYGRYKWTSTVPGVGMPTATGWNRIQATGGSWTKDLESDATQFATATGQFTCRKAGVYQVSATAGFAVNGTGARGVQVTKNLLSTTGLANITTPSSTNSGGAIVSGLVDLIVGDTLEVWGYVNGATPNISDASLSVVQI
jgi:hypothetical protein